MRVFYEFRRQCRQAANQFLAIVIHWPHLMFGVGMHACRGGEVNGRSVNLGEVGLPVGHCVGGSFNFDMGKSFAGLGVDRLETCSVGEALDDYIAIVVIEFDAISPPTGLLGRDQRRPAAREGVEDDAAPLGAVQDRIGDQRDVLYGRV